VVRAARPAVEEAGDLGAGRGLAELGEDALEAVPVGAWVFSPTAEGDELASAARAQRNAWLDQRLQALSAEDRAVIARAMALLGGIADS